MKLEKGMYAHGIHGRGSNAFGLSDGQMRAFDYVHNGGWYNAKGEKLGWGDLDLKDLKRISEELPEGEVFVVLSESDANDFNGRRRGDATNFDLQAPGVDYVCAHARLIIRKDGVYQVRSESSVRPIGPEVIKENPARSLGGQECCVTWITRDRARHYVEGR